MITTTTKAFSEKHGITYATATAIIALMVAKGLGKEVAKQPAAGGRGKPSTVFELQPKFEFQL